MPRQARIDAPGVIHHVIQRGIGRGRIFDGKDDYEAFLGRLGTILGEAKTRCYAWTLMPNHFHLLLRTGRDPMGRVMQRLLTWYAGRYNRRNERSGHLFQNRFRSIICQKEPYFLELVRYIHLNPVRAGMARTLKDLLGYEWSGHGVLMGRRRCEWQDSDAVLSQFGRTARQSRERYVEFVRDGFSQGQRKEFEGGGVLKSMGGVVEYLKAEKARGGSLAGEERILGDREFVEEILAEAERRETRCSRLRRRGWDIEIAVRMAAGDAGLEPSLVRGKGRTREQCRARSLACFWAVDELGYSGAEVARHLGISNPAVTMNVRRGREIVRREGLSLEQARHVNK